MTTVAAPTPSHGTATCGGPVASRGYGAAGGGGVADP